MAVASSGGHAVASGVWCSARLVEVGRSKGKAKRSEAKRSTSGRSEREAGLPRARMHTHTHQRSVGSRTRLLEVASVAYVKLDKPQVSSLSTCEPP